VRKLRSLASANTPTRLIARELGRTEDAVRTKAQSLAVSLKSTKPSLQPSERLGPSGPPLD
jgi:hypothetical protein